MNTAHSNWTGRTHRTMQGAFGPHTPDHLEPMHDDSVTDVALVLASVAAVALAVVSLFVWGLV